MKLIKLICLLSFAFIFTECQTNLNNNKDQKSENDSFPKASSIKSDNSANTNPQMDSLVIKISNGSNLLIVPGKSIGAIALNTDPEILIKLIGPPKNSDAAMCKSLSSWQYGSGAIKEFDISTECAADAQMQPRIQWLRTTDIVFKTTQGLGVGSTLQNIKNIFGKVVLSSSYEDSNNVKMQIWSVPNKNIAFETTEKPSQICKAVVVYTAKDGTPNLYLPFYDYMKSNWK